MSEAPSVSLHELMKDTSLRREAIVHQFETNRFLIGEASFKFSSGPLGWHEIWAWSLRNPFGASHDKPLHHLHEVRLFAREFEGEDINHVWIDVIGDLDEEPSEFIESIGDYRVFLRDFTDSVNQRMSTQAWRWQERGVTDGGCDTDESIRDCAHWLFTYLGLRGLEGFDVDKVINELDEDLRALTLFEECYEAEFVTREEVHAALPLLGIVTPYSELPAEEVAR